MVIRIQSPYAYGEFINVGDSGSSYLQDNDRYFSSVTGSYVDPYRYPALEQEIIEDLWKCHCGRVHKVSEELVCERCGSPITEKSRFVLE